MLLYIFRLLQAKTLQYSMLYYVQLLFPTFLLMLENVRLVWRIIVINIMHFACYMTVKEPPFCQPPDVSTTTNPWETTTLLPPNCHV